MINIYMFKLNIVVKNKKKVTKFHTYAGSTNECSSELQTLTMLQDNIVFHLKTYYKFLDI